MHLKLMRLHCYELHLRSCLAVVACLEHLLLRLLARTSTTVEAKDWLSAWDLDMVDCLTVGLLVALEEADAAASLRHR